VQLPAVNTPQFGWVKSRLPNKAQPVPPIMHFQNLKWIMAGGAR
jgi:hypothetical protein